MSSTIQPALQAGGLATGLDTTSLIQKLVAVEQQPITLYETQQLKLKAQATAYTDLNTKLLDLRNKSDVLRDAEKFFARSVTSSDSTVATATASAGTAKGTYTITSTGLARGAIAASANTVGATTTAVATGTDTFQFQLGSGAVQSVPIDGATTLDSLVSAINDLNAGVKASVVNTGTSDSPAYKLSLTSNATGSANDITIVHDGTTLAVANTQTATDATFTVTGLGNFTRSTNSFSDVLDGVTITLQKASGSTDLVIGYDNNGVQTALQNFLNAYNSVVQAIDTQSAVTTASDGTTSSGAFTGDVDTRTLRQHLTDILRSSVSGAAFGTMAEIGITTQQDGTLTLDSTMLQDALSTDPQGVSDLVAGPSGNDSGGIADQFYTLADSATTAITGMIAVRQDGLTQSIQSLQDQIDASQARLAAYQAQLQAQFANLEQIAAQLQTTGDFLTQQFKALANSQSSK